MSDAPDDTSDNAPPLEDDAFALALAGFRLGESDTVLRLDGPDQFAQATLALVAQTRRELCIVSPDFEPERFNNADFASALARLARRSRYASIRILVGDPGIAVRWGHKVVALSHRISSTLRIRQLDEDDFNPQEAWIVADDIGLLRRDNAEILKGSLVARAIPHGPRAGEKFTHWWERSREIADFRQLHI